MKLSVRQRAALVKTSSVWKGNDRIIGVAVSMSELSVDRDIGPSSYNGSCCYGWWQINLDSHRDKIPGNTDEAKLHYLYTPVGCMRIAEKVWQEAGNSWTPWQVFTEQTYVSNVDEASKAVTGRTIDLEGIIEGVGSQGVNAVSSVTSPLAAIGQALAWITHPHNWLRVAAFLGGLVILVLALVPLLKNQATGIVRQAVKG